MHHDRARLEEHLEVVVQVGGATEAVTLFIRVLRMVAM